jgi:hypothetical protein
MTMISFRRLRPIARQLLPIYRGRSNLSRIKKLGRIRDAT